MHTPHQHYLLCYSVWLTNCVFEVHNNVSLHTVTPRPQLLCCVTDWICDLGIQQCSIVCLHPYTLGHSYLYSLILILNSLQADHSSPSIPQKMNKLPQLILLWPEAALHHPEVQNCQDPIQAAVSCIEWWRLWIGNSWHPSNHDNSAVFSVPLNV